MNQMLLLERVHLTFEVWFIKQLQGNLIPEDLQFSILDMRKVYLALCWKEETLWKEWCKNVVPQIILGEPRTSSSTQSQTV